MTADVVGTLVRFTDQAGSSNGGCARGGRRQQPVCHSHGRTYSRFRRALLSKNVTLINAAARELQHVGREDTPRILVVPAERRDQRFEHAATRFAGRVTTEQRPTLAEARYVLAVAEALPRSPDAIALLLQATAADGVSRDGAA